MNTLHVGKLISYLISCRTTKDFAAVQQKSKFLLQGFTAINDDEISSFIHTIFDENISKEIYNLENLSVLSNNFLPWINSGSSYVNGLDKFDADISAGTTQSFDSFYYRHRDKRFRCFVGEYFYHVKTWESNSSHWSFIDAEDPLELGDALVLSLPFCDTGSIIDNYEDILQKCSTLNIPVLIDCCYYVLTGNFKLNLSYPCIDTVVFGLSKSFLVSHLRIGVRFTSTKIFDGQKLHHSINYNNTLSAYIGNKIIQKFPPDYLFNKYRGKQIDFCNFTNTVVSDSVIYAIGDSHWDMFSRRNLLNVYKLALDPTLFVNRILLSPVFENWDLYDVIKNET